MTLPLPRPETERRQLGRRMELVVRGELGPVLRAALKPHATARTEHSTVLRLVAPSADLLAVLETLHAKGLRVTSVRKLRRVERTSSSDTRQAR